MPTYVYKFIDTDETIEVQQAFTDDALTEAVHPTTGTTMQVKKVFLPVGVTFRGGGFYKTDSRGPGAKSKSTIGESSSGESSSDKSSSDKSSSDKSSDTSSGDKSASTTSTSSDSGSSATKTPAASTPAASSSSSD